MVRKGLWSALIALFALFLLVMTVMAQDEIAPEEATALPVTVDSTSANVVQTVPVTLTLSLPGPTGVVTIQVPVFLSLNIHIGISSGLTTTLEVTPSIVTSGTAFGVETPDAEATSDETGEGTPPSVTIVEPDDVSTAESTPENTAESTDENAEATATDVPTATPTPELATETAQPAATEESEATEVPLPTATATPVEQATQEAAAPACPDPRAVIVSPGVGQMLADKVNILGTATHENFDYYKVEYAQGENIDPNDSYSFLGSSNTPVTGGLLASFNSVDFNNGPYTLKLTVVDRSGNFPPPCTVSVVVEN